MKIHISLIFSLHKFFKYYLIQIITDLAKKIFLLGLVKKASPDTL